MGDHKGYGLALIVDLLTGVLGGGAFGGGVKRLDENAPVDASHTCIAVDVSAFAPRQEFDRRVRELVDSVRRTPTAQDAREILVPGEREARTAAERDAHGIAYPADILAALETLAHTCGASVPAPARPAQVQS